MALQIVGMMSILLLLFLHLGGIGLWLIMPFKKLPLPLVGAVIVGGIAAIILLPFQYSTIDWGDGVEISAIITRTGVGLAMMMSGVVSLARRLL